MIFNSIHSHIGTHSLCNRIEYSQTMENHVPDDKSHLFWMELLRNFIRYILEHLHVWPLKKLKVPDHDGLQFCYIPFACFIDHTNWFGGKWWDVKNPEHDNDLEHTRNKMLTSRIDPFHFIFCWKIDPSRFCWQS